MDLADAVHICSCHWAEVRGPQSAAMDPLLRWQLGPKRSGTIPSSVVSGGDWGEATGACISLLVPSPSLLLRSSLLLKDLPSRESFLLLLSSLRAWGS